MKSIALFSLLLIAAPALAQDKAAPAAAAPAPEAKTKGKKASLVDLNTATADEMKALPGITDEIAQKIVAGRPYKGKDALLKQSIVDKDEYAKIRPLVVAKQPKKGAAPAAAKTEEKPVAAPAATKKDEKPAAK